MSSLCFARREGVETLLFCNTRCNRIVEVSVAGAFIRAIEHTAPSRIACSSRNVIAVSSALPGRGGQTIFLIDYSTGVTITTVALNDSNCGLWA